MLKNLLNTLGLKKPESNWRYMFLIGAGASCSEDIFSRVLGKKLGYDDFGRFSVPEFRLSFQVLKCQSQSVFVGYFCWPPYGYKALEIMLREPNAMYLFFKTPEFSHTIEKLNSLVRCKSKAFPCNTLMTCGGVIPETGERNPVYESAMRALVEEIWKEFRVDTGIDLSAGVELVNKLPSDFPYLSYFKDFEQKQYHATNTLSVSLQQHLGLKQA